MDYENNIMVSEDEKDDRNVISDVYGDKMDDLNVINEALDV